MTDERFWEIVDSVGWPVEDTDEARVEILMNTAPAEIKEFRSELDERTSKLHALFDEAREEMDEDFYVSGDGLSDCVNHIVGCGKHEYRVHVLNPEQTVRTYRNGRFVENFSYAVPYATEYEKLGTDYYVFRSDRYVDRYDEIARNEKFSEDYRRKAMFMKEVLEDFPNISGMDSYFQRHDMFATFSVTEGEKAVLDWMYQTEEELSEDVKGWPVRNLVSDYKTYYIYNQ
jgi:hypothetical protein